MEGAPVLHPVVVEVGGDVFCVVEQVCPAEGAAAEAVFPGVGGFDVGPVGEDAPLGLFGDAVAVVEGALAGEGEADGPVDEDGVGGANHLVEGVELGDAWWGDGDPLVRGEGGVVDD